MANVYKYVKEEVARMMATSIVSTGTNVEGALGFSAKLIDTGERRPLEERALGPEADTG